MSIDNAYAELGLAPGASESEVKAAWRRLVSLWHPDRNKTTNAVGRMQRINKAYEQLRLSGFTAGSPAANAGGYDDMAGRQSAHAGTPGRTIRRKVLLTLEEAALGCTKVFRGQVTDVCIGCAGQGFHVLDAACGDCKGTGVVRHHAWYGWLSSRSPCGTCDGDRLARKACHACEGTGKRTAPYRRTVRIPPGVRHGDVLSAEGGTRHGDLAGTLELRIELSAHQFFVLGDDGILRCEMPVDGFAWIGNRWIEVPTLTGVQKMRLQREHHVYRLRGQGFPTERRGDRGDYVVTVVPTFPESLSAEQDELLDRLIAGSDGPDSKAGASPVRHWHRTLRAWEGALRKDDSFS